MSGETSELISELRATEIDTLGLRAAFEFAACEYTGDPEAFCWSYGGVEDRQIFVFRMNGKKYRVTIEEERK